MIQERQTANITPKTLLVDLFSTKIGWLVLAGYTDHDHETVMRLLIGNNTKKEAEACWQKEVNTGRLSQIKFENDPQAIRFTNWYPAGKKKLEEYARGIASDFSTIRCDLALMTTFQQEVLKETQQISTGELITYRKLALQVGRPQAARAIGSTMAKNPVPIIIPCHRVIGSNGKLTGFTAPGGIALKQKLLELETNA